MKAMFPFSSAAPVLWVKMIRPSDVQVGWLARSSPGPNSVTRVSPLPSGRTVNEVEIDARRAPIAAGADPIRDDGCSGASAFAEACRRESQAARRSSSRAGAALKLLPAPAA